MILSLFLFFINILLFYCQISRYLLLNESNYEKISVIEDLSTNEHIFTLTKNESSTYSLNDGFFIELNNSISKPKQLHFSYKVNNKSNINTTSFEGCNLRLTSMNYEELIEKKYLTNNSDIIFFRVRYDDRISFNDIHIYLNTTQSNFGIRTKDRNNDEYINADIFIKWEDKKVYFFLEGLGKWNVAAENGKEDKIKMREFSDFYHEELPNDKPFNKIILYNFSPNSSCSIKDIKICGNEFCGEKYKEEYNKYLSSKYLNINRIIIIMSFIFLLI